MREASPTTRPPGIRAPTHPVTHPQVRNDRKNQPNHALSVWPTLLLECGPLVLLAFAAVTKLALEVWGEVEGRPTGIWAGCPIRLS